MFSNIKSTWHSLHWLVRAAIVAFVLYLLFAVLSLVVGTGSWGKAQAAEFHPNGAELFTITGVREEKTSVKLATLASSTHEVSVQWRNRKSYMNKFGQDLIWLNMTANGRYSLSQHRITFAPAAEVTAGVTTLGSIGQWKIQSLESNQGQYYTYKGHPNGGYLWWSVLTATRCLPAPFVGCVQLGTVTETIATRGHYDGTASLY